MENKEKILTFLIIIVFGSGFLIYGVNRLRGVNLGEPPKFELSAFDLHLQPPEFNVAEQQNESLDEAAIAAIKGKIMALKAEEENKIFFSNYFKQATFDETDKMLNDFFADFPELKKYPIKDLWAKQAVVAELPAIGREALIKKISADPLIEKVQIAENGAPFFSVYFKSPMYEKEVAGLFEKYPGAVLNTKFVQADFAAVLDLGQDAASVGATLEKLKKEYGDVVSVNYGQ